MKLNEEPDVRWLEGVTLDPTREEIEDLARFNALKKRFFDPIEKQSRKNNEVLLRLLDAPPNPSGVYHVRFHGREARY